MYGVGDSREAVECDCLRERRVVSQLPAQYADASLADFPRPTAEQVVDWVGDSGQGLVITGEPGRGKTYLASAITRSLLLIGHAPVMRRAFQVFSELRRALQSGEEELVFGTYVLPRYLFLDDLEFQCSEFERRFFLELLDRRLTAARSTCVTTNSTFDEMNAVADQRLVSRLSGFRWIRLEGPDLRQFPKNEVRMEISDAAWKLAQAKKSEMLGKYTN